MRHFNFSTSTSTTYCLPSKRRFWQGDRPEWKASNTLEIELDSKSPPIMKSCIFLQFYIKKVRNVIRKQSDRREYSKKSPINVTNKKTAVICEIKSRNLLFRLKKVSEK